MPETPRQTHTPGPWTACKGGDCPCGFIWDASEQVQVATAHDHSAIGTDGYDSDIGVSVEEREANARLIAAAPDLKDALRAFVDEYKGDDINEGAWPLMDQARAALTKAEGDQP